MDRFQLDAGKLKYSNKMLLSSITQIEPLYSEGYTVFRDVYPENEYVAPFVVSPTYTIIHVGYIILPNCGMIFLQLSVSKF